MFDAVIDTEERIAVRELAHGSMRQCSPDLLLMKILTEYLVDPPRSLSSTGPGPLII